jgi:hypothetical protein
MKHESISIIKTTGSLFSTLGLIKKKKIEVLSITDNSLFYYSTLGNIGEIKAESIDFIELTKLDNSEVIKIGVKKSFNFASKLTKFKQKLSELYEKNTGAAILIFPQDVDMELKVLAKLLKDKLYK